MVNGSGTIVINGITDPELVKILEIKIKHEGHLNFNPQQLQPNAQNRAPGKTEQFYNNAFFNWAGEKGLEAIHEVLTYLLKKEERHEAAVGQ